MVETIKRIIERTYDNEGLDAAKAKYNTYFVTKASKYGVYQEAVNIKLVADGYGDIIA